MTPEARFLVFALLGVGYFAPQLLFGNIVGSRHTREWREASGVPMLRVFGRVLLTLNVAAQPWAIVLLLVLLSSVVLLLFLEIAPGMVFAACVAAIVFFFAVYRLIRIFCDWQATRFEERLAEAIDVMVAALVAGANPLKAFEAAVQWTEGRISRELHEIIRRLELGLDMNQALARIMSIYDSEGARLFCQSLRAKWHVGADLAEMLMATARLIRERKKIRMQAGGQLSGMRYAALLVGCMPHVLYAFFLLYQPQWVAAIHADPTGEQLIYTALALQMLGFAWLSSTLRLEG